MANIGFSNITDFQSFAGGLSSVGTVSGSTSIFGANSYVSFSMPQLTKPEDYTVSNVGGENLGSNLFERRLYDSYSSLNDKSQTLQNLGGILDSQASTLNSTRDYNTYSNTLSSYNANVTTYNNLLNEFRASELTYNKELDVYEKIMTSRMVATTDVEIPNLKDKNQSLSGGVFYSPNGQSAGGSIWSPTEAPSMSLGYTEVAKNAKLINGQILPYLGYGFGSIMSLVNGGKLDLMFKYKVKETRVVRVTTTARYSNSGELLYASTNNMNLGGDYYGEGSSTDNSAYGNISHEQTRTSERDLNALARAWSTRTDIRSLVAMSPITIAMTLYDVVTNTEVTIEDRINGMMLGTMTNVFSQFAVKGAMSLMNVTTIGQFIGLNMVVGGIIGELAEMALGLDNHFGFGGDIVGVDRYGNAHYMGEIDTFEGITGVIGEMFEGLYNFFAPEKYEINVETAYDEMRAKALSEMEMVNTYGGMLGYGDLYSNEADMMNSVLSTPTMEDDWAIGIEGPSPYGTDYGLEFKSWDTDYNGLNDTYESLRNEIFGDVFGDGTPSSRGGLGYSGTQQENQNAGAMGALGML